MAQAMKTPRPWTAADFETAKRLYLDGMSVMDIALVVKRTAASVKAKINEARLRRITRSARPEGVIVERPARALWPDEDIADAYEAAGLRYEDHPRSVPDHRRFVSNREIGGIGCAADMCANAQGARGYSVAPNGARRAA